jgi:hypothetical protein
MQKSPIYPFYLTIGVTGHRDIPTEDGELIKSVIKSRLLHLQATYKNTPLIVLSGLAEGADRLVVEVADEMDIAFVAILPLPKDDYATDFNEPGSKQDFYKWLDKAAWVETLTQATTESNVSYLRNACYEQLGFYLTNNSHLLLALWDGDKQEKTGGTSQVVRYFLQGVSGKPQDKTTALNLPSYRPVEHILTRRLSQLNAIGHEQIGALETLWPTVTFNDDAWLEKRWSLSLLSLGTFNQDMQQFGQTNPEPVLTSRRYLLGDDVIYSTFDTKGQRIADLFAISDAMSSFAQSRRHKNFIALVIFALSAVVSQQSYGFFLQWYLLVGSLSLGGISFWLYQQSQSQRLEEKYLDYRALAEGLRVQFFWHIAGVNLSVSDFFLREQRDELEWIRQTITSTQLKSEKETHKKSHRWIIERWVRDQRIYFIGDHFKGRLGKARIDARAEKKLTRRMKQCFFTGLGIMLISAIGYEWIYPDLTLEWKSLLLNGLLATSGAILCIVPSIKIYLDTMAFDEHAKRYLRMGQYYGLCEKQLERLDEAHTVEIDQLFIDIGKQALIETGDWLLLHRQRPVKVPVM